ncbi:MAG TPA: hypothetical protein VHF69_14290, partial [Candidatus Synoicihabitans sp.]|nr:hypothetical protein [Candidatus Synoicihabitans sp.]
MSVAPAPPRADGSGWFWRAFALFSLLVVLLPLLARDFFQRSVQSNGIPATARLLGGEPVSV